MADKLITKTVRMSEGLFKALTKEAKEDDRSLNKYIVKILKNRKK